MSKKDEKNKIASLKDRAGFFGAKLDKTAIVKKEETVTKTTTVRTLKKVDGKIVQKSEKTDITKLKSASQHLSRSTGIIQINHPAVRTSSKLSFSCMFQQHLLYYTF